MAESRDARETGLVIRGLKKRYPGGVQALRGVDLEVREGMYGLLGPNGAGKSTLMRILATLVVPDGGSFTLDGVDGGEDPRAIRARLGYLPQQVGAYPRVSAAELLGRFGWLKGLRSARERQREVGVLLERVNLEDAAQRAVAEFSGGMLRRFGIAVALLGQPRLVVVDEPTAGLDPAERNRFHRVLSEVAADAVVLLSTHIVEDIEHLCRELSILVDGEIAAAGSPATLCRALAGRLFEKTLARHESPPEDTLRALASPTGTRVIVEADEAPSGGWAPVEPRLEDAYYASLNGRGAGA